MVIKLDDDDYVHFLNNQNGHDDQIIDPVYKVFLEHLREDGKSYVFEMINEDHGSPMVVKYEEENELSERNKANTLTSSDTIHFERKYNSVTLKKWKKRLCTKSGVVHPSSVHNNHPELPLEEESYLTFLSHLKFKDSSMVLELESVSINYEEERETSDPSEILADESNRLVPYQSSQPSDLTVYEDGESAIVSDDCCEVTDFKTKLMFVLNKPYNQAEYEELLRKATERKPLTKQKHLRSMSISYETDEVGQSYLDHFPDLAEQIWSSDFYKRLNLLRGFFLWLKNLSHEGAYMPWASPGYEVITTDDCEVVFPLDIARD